MLFGCGRGVRNDTGTIAGRVTLETQLVYSGVTVSVQGTAISAATLSNGDYLLTGIPAGAYVLAAAAPGYGTATREITVAVGSSSTGIDFFLQLSSPPVIPFHR